MKNRYKKLTDLPKIMFIVDPVWIAPLLRDVFVRAGGEFRLSYWPNKETTYACFPNRNDQIRGHIVDSFKHMSTIKGIAEFNSGFDWMVSRMKEAGYKEVSPQEALDMFEQVASYRNRRPRYLKGWIPYFLYPLAGDTIIEVWARINAWEKEHLKGCR